MVNNMRFNKKNERKFRLYRPVILTGSYGDVIRRYPGLDGIYEEEFHRSSRVFLGSMQPRSSESLRLTTTAMSAHGISSLSEFVVYTGDPGIFSVPDRLAPVEPEPLEEGARRSVYEITALTRWPGFTTLFVKEVE